MSKMLQVHIETTCFCCISELTPSVPRTVLSRGKGMLLSEPLPLCAAAPLSSPKTQLKSSTLIRSFQVVATKRTEARDLELAGWYEASCTGGEHRKGAKEIFEYREHTQKADCERRDCSPAAQDLKRNTDWIASFRHLCRTKGRSCWLSVCYCMYLRLTASSMFCSYKLGESHSFRNGYGLNLRNPVRPT